MTIIANNVSTGVRIAIIASITNEEATAIVCIRNAAVIASRRRHTALNHSFSCAFTIVTINIVNGHRIAIVTGLARVSARAVVDFCSGIIVARCCIRATRRDLWERNGETLGIVTITRFIVVLEIHNQRHHAVCRQLRNEYFVIITCHSVAIGSGDNIP